LRPENREIFSNPPLNRSKSADFERQAHAFMREPWEEWNFENWGMGERPGAQKPAAAGRQDRVIITHRKRETAKTK
jgi:hypothetical protein